MFAFLLTSMRLSRKLKQKPQENSRKKSLMSCCRTCLSAEDVQPIFSAGNIDKNISEELLLTTGLTVNINDGLPQNLCSKCMAALQNAKTFRVTSQKANETLASLGFSRESKTKWKTETLDIEVPAYNNIPNPDINGTEKSAINELIDNYNDDPNDDFYNDTDVAVEKTNTKRQKASKINSDSLKCHICNKEFRMKGTYRAHMRFHTNFCVCELCGKKCRNNNLLLLHKRGKHAMERIHRCAHCSYTSANKEGLVIHSRRHTGEKPYTCDHCGASFHRRSNLVQHIAIHLPEKKFQCDICLKRFHSKKFVQGHQFKAHRERRHSYACPACRALFRSSDAARKHLTRAHAVPRADQPRICRVPRHQGAAGDS